MAPGDPIASGLTIYRALTWKNLDRKSKEPKDTAFLLKPAHDSWPDETYLSFGVSQEAAKAGLTNVPRVCEILVSDILELGLQVTEDDDPQKVCVSGMPLITVNEELALTIAKDLRGKSKTCLPAVVPDPHQ
jgi:hypothetical protein